MQLTTSEGMKFRPLECGGGRVFYWYNGGVWSVPADGGEEKLILDEDIGVFQWRTWNGKIVYIRQSESGPSIVLFDYERQERTTLHTFEPQTQLGTDLAVSADGRWVLYTQLDQSGSDLMLVENFR